MKVSTIELQKRQSWSFARKVKWALRQIRLWYDFYDGQVYVAFSGGKDSTVLLHLVRSLYPDVVAVFANTGLAFPETVKFVRSIPNVVFVKPDRAFPKVLKEDGYPVVSKEVSRYIWDIRRPKGVNPNTKRLRLTGMTQAGRYLSSYKLAEKWKFLLKAPFLISDKCCIEMKERPLNRYQRESGCEGYDGIMAGDSRRRRMTYLQYGCNSYDTGRPVSRPLSIWTTEDVWQYIRENKVPYSPVYDMGYERTGCIFCPFGAHLEDEPNRFQLLKKTHPRLWKYCMGKLGMCKVLKFVGVPIK